MWHSSAKTYIIFLDFLLQQIISLRWMSSSSSTSVTSMTMLHSYFRPIWGLQIISDNTRQTTHDKRQIINLLLGPALQADGCNNNNKNRIKRNIKSSNTNSTSTTTANSNSNKKQLKWGLIYLLGDLQKSTPFIDVNILIP